MTRRAQSAEELRFQARYIRSLGIAGLISCPVLIALGLTPLMTGDWKALVIATGIGMALLGTLEYRVAYKVLRHLPS